jgi:hypothetical protein
MLGSVGGTKLYSDPYTDSDKTLYSTEKIHSTCMRTWWMYARAATSFVDVRLIDRHRPPEAQH